MNSLFLTEIVLCMWMDSLVGAWSALSTGTMAVLFSSVYYRDGEACVRLYE